MSEPAQICETSAVVWAPVVLWILCLGLWLTLSIQFAGLLVPGTATGLSFAMQSLTRVAFFAASATAGGLFLTLVALCDDQPQSLQAGGWRFELPRRRLKPGSALGRDARATVELFGISVALLVVGWVVKTY